VGRPSPQRWLNLESCLLARQPKPWVCRQLRYRHARCLALLQATEDHRLAVIEQRAFQLRQLALAPDEEQEEDVDWHAWLSKVNLGLNLALNLGLGVHGLENLHGLVERAEVAIRAEMGHFEHIAEIANRAQLDVDGDLRVD
jgi:hypothetical protein